MLKAIFRLFVRLFKKTSRGLKSLLAMPLKLRRLSWNRGVVAALALVLIGAVVLAIADKDEAYVPIGKAGKTTMEVRPSNGPRLADDDKTKTDEDFSGKSSGSTSLGFKSSKSSVRGVSTTKPNASPAAPTQPAANSGQPAAPGNSGNPTTPTPTGPGTPASPSNPGNPTNPGLLPALTSILNNTLNTANNLVQTTTSQVGNTVNGLVGGLQL